MKEQKVREAEMYPKMVYGCDAIDILYKYYEKTKHYQSLN